MGGTQSLHTNSLDEAYALPSEHAGHAGRCGRSRSSPTRAALRLSRSWSAASSWIASPPKWKRRRTTTYGAHRRDGGMIPAIEELSAARDRAGQLRVPAIHRIGRAKDRRRERLHVEDEQPIELLEIDESAAGHQVEKLAALRRAATEPGGCRARRAAAMPPRAPKTRCLSSWRRRGRTRPWAK